MFLDSLTVGSISYPDQAIVAANDVSQDLAYEEDVDGILGLGLGYEALSSIEPQPQRTWFDNIKSKLAVPLFTSSLKHGVVSGKAFLSASFALIEPCTSVRHRRCTDMYQGSSYDFGFLDDKKYQGELAWVDVQKMHGSWKGWNFPVTGFQIGDGQMEPVDFTANADTGCVLCKDYHCKVLVG